MTDDVALRARLFHGAALFRLADWQREAAPATPAELAEMEELLRERDAEREASLTREAGLLLRSPAPKNGGDGWDTLGLAPTRSSSAARSFTSSRSGARCDRKTLASSCSSISRPATMRWMMTRWPPP